MFRSAFACLHTRQPVGSVCTCSLELRCKAMPDSEWCHIVIVTQLMRLSLRICHRVRLRWKSQQGSTLLRNQAQPLAHALQTAAAAGMLKHVPGLLFKSHKMPGGHAARKPASCVSQPNVHMGGGADGAGAAEERAHGNGCQLC